MKKFINKNRSFMAALCELYLRVTCFKKIYKTEAATQKFIEEKRAENINEYFLPKYDFGCSVREEKCGPLKVFIFNGKTNPQNVIFYFHGGAYFKNPLNFHLRFIKKLVKGTGAEVRLVVYPKAPVYTCQTAFNLCLKYYYNFSKQNPNANVTFMGDSSGGGLALALAQKISVTNAAMPKNLILFSPWLDVELNNAEIIKRDKRDPMHSSVGLRLLGKVWAGELNLKDPVVSPKYGKILYNCNIILYVGTRELLYPDIAEYYYTLKQKNENCQLIVGNGLNHVWNIFPIPEAKKALSELCDLIRR